MVLRPSSFDMPVYIIIWSHTLSHFVLMTDDFTFCAGIEPLKVCAQIHIFLASFVMRCILVLPCIETILKSSLPALHTVYLVDVVALFCFDYFFSGCMNSSWSILKISQMYHINCFVLFVFADDSNIFLSAKNPDLLIFEITSEIVRITDWLAAIFESFEYHQNTFYDFKL